MSVSQPSANPIVLCRAALRLRAWARPLLLGDGAPAAPPAVATAGWSLFLAAERCALPLRRRLEREGREGSLAADAWTLLQERAGEELQRVLGARFAARQVARAAESCAGPVAVLKGGVIAFDDETAVDLVDLDVLAAQTDANRLANAMAVEGFRPRGAASPGGHHLPSQHDAGGAVVEVHHALGRGAPSVGPALWTATTALALAKGLHRLGAADHLGHVLAHSAAAHPDRRGTLRDLLVLQHAARAVTAAGRAAAVAALPDESRRVGRALLRAAAVDAPAPPDDEFATVAAASYLLRALSVRDGFRWMAQRSFALAVHPMLGLGDDRPRLLRSAFAWRAPLLEWRRFAEAAPSAASLARVALSVARLPPAAALALAARRLARPYDAHPA